MVLGGKACRGDHVVWCGVGGAAHGGDCACTGKTAVSGELLWLWLQP